MTTVGTVKLTAEVRVSVEESAGGAVFQSSMKQTCGKFVFVL